jgi:CubicO group peptidase (beta-lactamase class C family)
MMKNDRTMTRRAVSAGVAVSAAGALTGGYARPGVLARQAATPETGTDIVSIARDAMAEFDLRAVILRVVIDGEEIVTEALGESMTGVPATTDMHFRNGAVAIAYMATALLQLVDQGVVGLDDSLSRWLPDLPNAEQVTLRMLSNMTAGYADYVQDAGLVDALIEDPFRQWGPQELIEVSTSKPHVFAPGTNWDYSHTNYVILGQALERITGKPLATLIDEEILTPLGLSGTQSASTPAIPEPVLHAYSSERREFLGVDPGARFYEESTFWNPSWTLADGAIQTTTIQDMTTTAIAVGTGSLLSAASHEAQVGLDLLGFGAPLDGCPTCHTLDERYVYGLGIFRSGDWLQQNPLFYGYGSVAAYLPSQKVAVGLVTTFGEQSFDEHGAYLSGRASQHILARISTLLAPDAAPPWTR